MVPHVPVCIDRVTDIRESLEECIMKRLRVLQVFRPLLDARVFHIR
jgi:hypothetical protein